MIDVALLLNNMSQQERERESAEGKMEGLKLIITGKGNLILKSNLTYSPLEENHLEKLQ